MACKIPDDDYTVVEELTDVTDVLAEIKSHDLLAVDSEGIDLGRAGDLTVLTVATPIKSYIFDILKLGKQVFDDGLREILEDKTMEKLMFDCRGDADSLRHQFQVHLSGVLDLQLLEVMHRTKSPSAPAASSSGSRRSTRTSEVEHVYGFQRCIELYVDDKAMIDKKKSGKIKLRSDKDAWKKRPLQDVLKTYCCVDTNGLFILYDKLKGDGEFLPRLRVASDRYAGYFRSLPARTHGMFEKHNFLPLDIIPDAGSLTFQFATTKCVGCLRLFPREEFSKNQLRNRDQKCRVCKAVKLRADREECSWSRTYHSSDYYSDLSSDHDGTLHDMMKLNLLLEMQKMAEGELKKDIDRMLIQGFYFLWRSAAEEEEFDVHD